MGLKKWGELVRERGYGVGLFVGFVGAGVGGLMMNKFHEPKTMIGGIALGFIIGFVLGHMFDPEKTIIYQEIPGPGGIRHSRVSAIGEHMSDDEPTAEMEVKKIEEKRQREMDRTENR